MIRCRDLGLRFGDAQALDGVSLHVRSGEMAGLLGPNGSGKTTLLRTVAGSVQPDRGRAEVMGQDVAGLAHKERARRIAFVPQRPDGVPRFTVLDMVLMGRYPHVGTLESFGPEDHRAARGAMEETGIARFSGRLAATLSGGELQRVYIARALTQETPLLLLDEPASGLDPAQAQAVFERVRAKNADGLTVLAAIHDLNLAALYCDRLIVLKAGQVAADGPVREVFVPSVLESVYETRFIIVEHPAANRPQALLLPGGDRA